jgi:hypothetical protein
MINYRKWFLNIQQEKNKKIGYFLIPEVQNTVVSTEIAPKICRL